VRFTTAGNVAASSWRYGDLRPSTDFRILQPGELWWIVSSTGLGAKMGFYSPLPCLAIIALLMCLASTPLLKWAEAPPTDIAVRDSTIDGLRGLLALGVFFHHAAIWHRYIVTGEWDFPPSRFYNNLGPAGVSMFFMITGYLFWSQMLKAKGRPNFLKLYVGRLFRIVPLYLVLALIVLATVGFATNWRLNESPFAASTEVARSLAGGVLNIPHEINAYPETWLVSADVTWTLRCEWVFYASLIVTAFFARNELVGFLLPLAGLVAVVLLVLSGHRSFAASFTLLFSAGMISAAIPKPLASAALNGIPQWALSAVAAGAVALAVTGFDGMFGVAPGLLLGASFLLIVSGATFFGLLVARPARRLGDISYGIYLLQGPVLLVAFCLPALRAASAASPAVHWSLVATAAAALTAFATVTHSLIERPGIRAGRRALTRIDATQRRRPVTSESAVRTDAEQGQSRA
jgi:peptidoglycan/LPS O-acetylase OafA/YrhL